MTVGDSRPSRGGRGRRSRRLLRLLAVGLLAIPAGAALPSAHAATTRYVSTTGTDSPTCGTAVSPCKTIQYTITNIAANGDTISIAAGTYHELVTITKNLSLVGAGTATVPPSAPTSIIDGTGLKGSVVTVNAGVTAGLTLLTIQHGSGTVLATIPNAVNHILGGGILNLGTLTVTDSFVINNMTSSIVASAAEGDGGGIYNHATLTVSSSTISGNVAGNGPFTRVVGFSNSGGGIFSDTGSTLTIDESTVSGNSVPGDTHIPSESSTGGGISNIGGTMTLTSSTVSGNTVTRPAVLTIPGITTRTIAAVVPAAGGGGIENDAPATSTIANSTITGNTATGAGAATAIGGGINKSGVVTLINDTITSNAAVTNTGAATGGGVAVPGAMGNTILASNTTKVGAAAAVSSDCSAKVTTDNGGNLADDATCFNVATENNVAGLAASIAPLANNGGETMTQALLPGSPAIDAGLATTCEAAPINDLDQRGMPRYAVQRGDCDSGAYDTGGGIVEPLTITGAFPLTSFPAGPARLGFAASNNGSFTGVTLQNFPIGYITFQLGGSLFTVRRPVLIACTSTIAGGDHCLGAMGVIQGVSQFVATPGATATLTLSGIISTAHGAYPVGTLGTVTLTVSASPLGVITVSKVSVSVNGVVQVTWTAPFPFATSIIIQTSPLFIP